MMNLDVVKKYVEQFEKEIAKQSTENYEGDPCRDVYEKWLADLQLTHVVELGAGVGTLLKLFPNTVRVTGVSLGGEAGMIAEDMNTPMLEDGECDLVIARHALEHSLIPLIMLCEMSRLTTAYALVIVPSCSEEMAEYQNHYSVFTPVALRSLFKRAGFTVEKEELGVPLYRDITEDRFLLKKL